MVNLDLRPIGIEFVGYDQGQRCAAATTHLGAMSNDGDGAVTCDTEEDTWLKKVWGIIEYVGPKRFGYEACTQHKRPSCDGALQKSAAADILDVVHAISFAAW